MANKELPPGVADAEADGAGKGKGKLIIIIVIALVLAIGLSVGGTLFFLNKDGDEQPAPAVAAEPVRQPAIYEELAPAFVVNFNHNGRQRYMQVTLSLMSRDPLALDELKVHMPLLRNRLVMLFSSQDFATLATPVGKEALRQQATASVQEMAQKETGKLVVEQVLFTNFVLQ
ncbi:flagellar basal body-associated protein FliL [Stutzerimonas kirkiae]|uniref:Flagellar protein FliL n=1 Tax=Stutzerimonas kirkiae TaxID=2211392 RepID=A0A4Q9RBA6_9GAMM|nr:flagellar basal body-associated protein FliL [Stutzerimonas kirkiae]TBU98160.1 flagellar basal body-associated protein FliL [Stutzerimonas kirkiae]TBV02325.1 flagellar basal body-associated protein FliL [Stutzerimonas kirkiae]TBV11211.1 flagellar basal body-associated protein FliL [Stutzerimonas kirkiae]TBV14636.1 flagellar basal body-associated protein FliL [Stutzerimonas kirkiae]